jgi:ribosomal protein S18 acetylase RimI-like enzyme
MQEAPVVTIRQFGNMTEALLAQGCLQSAGIECFLSDVNVARMEWPLVTRGMRLQVNADDAEAAVALLDRVDGGVRRATAGDLEMLVPLFDAYRQFYRMPGDIDLARRFLRERLEQDESVIFVALLADGSAAGFTQLYPSFSSVSAARILILNDLYVRPEARRKKIGSLLLGAAAEYGREVGAVRLTLSTEVTNTDAQALYEREGWVRQEEFYNYNLALE